MILFFVFLFGASIFSFLEVVIYRLPRKQNFITGRSFCPGCGKELTGMEMIPVVSYLFLRGKCHKCGEKIPLRDFLMELFGGAAAVTCFCINRSIEVRVLLFAMVSVLTVVSMIDMDTMEIPNGCILLLLGLGILSIWIMPEITLKERIIGLFAVSSFLYVVNLIIPNGFGGGDIKLMAGCGLFLGVKLILFAFFISILLGGIYGSYLLMMKKKGKKEYFAFGPFLCIGVIFSYLYGNAVLHWYIQLFW